MAGFGPIYVMSIAPANRASIAEGPALKLFHSILTCGPIAFSNHPLLLPTMACGCVMLGNAPTRIVFCAPASAPSKINNHAEAKKLRLVMALAPRRYRQRIGLWLLLPADFPVDGAGTGTGRLTADQVGKRRIFENLRSRIPYFKEHFVERAMVRIAIDESSQLFGIAKRRERPVNQTDDFAQADL